MLVIRDACNQERQVSEYATQDAYLAIRVRYDELEMTKGFGVTLPNVVKVKRDAGEQRTMKQSVTDVMATDGSKAGRRAAWGLWEGPAQRNGRWAAPESHAGTAARVAAGMAEGGGAARRVRCVKCRAGGYGRSAGEGEGAR